MHPISVVKDFNTDIWFYHSEAKEQYIPSGFFNTSRYTRNCFKEILNMNMFVTSDLHFNHKSILKFCANIDPYYLAIIMNSINQYININKEVFDYS